MFSLLLIKTSTIKGTSLMLVLFNGALLDNTTQEVWKLVYMLGIKIK